MPSSPGGLQATSRPRMQGPLEALAEAAATEDDSLAVPRDPHDVHALASEAADLEAQTEQFFDQVLITEINETPLTTLDGCDFLAALCSSLGCHLLAMLTRVARRPPRLSCLSVHTRRHSLRHAHVELSLLNFGCSGLEDGELMGSARLRLRSAY